MNENKNYSGFSFEPMDENSYRHTYSYGGYRPEEPKKKKGMAVKIVALALACALLGGVGGAGAVALAFRNDVSQDATVVDTPQDTQQNDVQEPAQDPVTMTPVTSGVIHVATNEEGKSLSPADVYASYAGSVVGISCETTMNVYGQVSTAATAGTGFVLSQDGYILTNNHVIDGADSIRVSLLDGTSYDATVVGAEADNDLALLKIDVTGLKPVAIGKSSGLVVGEMVCAIGNPLGELTDSLTVGYVSALDREINTDGTPINMLQTDCAINPGNSGGPLFDMNGNVIGITTAKYASDQIEGLGFAIPIDDAMAIVSDLLEYGYVTGKAYMGITPVTITETYAYYYNMPVGVYVSSVVEGSAAETAGIKQADIVLKLGEREVKTITDLSSALKKFHAGDTTTVTVWRSGEEMTLTITFDEKPAVNKEEPAVMPNQSQQNSGQYQLPEGYDPFGGLFDGFFGFGG